MNTLIILFFIISIVIYFIKNSFTTANPIGFLNQTNDVRTTIQSILSDPGYLVLINNVPGQTIFNITGGNHPTLAKSILQGNEDLVKNLKGNKKLINQTDTLIDALNNYISITQNTVDVYTPDKKAAFMVYYNNMLKNIQIIKNYIFSS